MTNFSISATRKWIAVESNLQKNIEVKLYNFPSWYNLLIKGNWTSKLRYNVTERVHRGFSHISVRYFRCHATYSVHLVSTQMVHFSVVVLLKFHSFSVGRQNSHVTVFGSILIVFFVPKMLTVLQTANGAACWFIPINGQFWKFWKTHSNLLTEYPFESAIRPSYNQPPKLLRGESFVCYVTRAQN
jgi:hypothetical protein